jgi:hypothetical protein
MANAVLKEMGAWCYCESKSASHGSIATMEHYYMPQTKTSVIVQVDRDSGVEVLAPVEKSNSVDATTSALKAL